jgi:hypothetical protein
MLRTFDAAVGDAAEGKFGRTMTAAIANSSRFAVSPEPQHQGLAQQDEWLRAISQLLEGKYRVPKATENGLLSNKHRDLSSKPSCDVYRVQNADFCITAYDTEAG